MEITFLGTSAGSPSLDRNVSSLALDLREVEEGFWLIDCGEATQHQILKTNITPSKITKIFITHLHGDHIFGLFGLLATMSAQGKSEELEIVAPKELQTALEVVFKISKIKINFPIKYTFLTGDLVMETPNFKISTLELDHDIETFAFKFEQKDLLGRFDIEKAKSLGVPVGKELGILQRGGSVTLENGSVVVSSDVMGKPRKGKVITVFGDTQYRKHFVDFAKGSDVLVYEGTLTPEDKAKNPYIKHSSYKNACDLAIKSESKTLLINHVSSRYIGSALKELKKETKKLFKKAHVVSDFSTFEI